jgi:hypothetical protein
MKSALTMIGVVCLGVFLWLIVPLYVLSSVNPPAATVQVPQFVAPARIVPPAGSVLKMGSPDFVTFTKADLATLVTREALDLPQDDVFSKMVSDRRAVFLMSGCRVRIEEAGKPCLVNVLDGELAGENVYVDPGKLVPVDRPLWQHD